MFALLLSHFLITMSQLKEHRDHEENETRCIVMSLMIHLFLLSTMGWMLVEGYILYK